MVVATHPTIGAGRGLAWHGGASSNPIVSPSATQSTRRAETNTSGVQGRARVQKSNNSTKSAKSTTRSRGRLGQDLDYLVGELAQDPAQLQAQLAQGQRPPVFDHVYRTQLAAQAAQAAGSGADSEDPMMPPMHMTERMQPLSQMPMGTSATQSMLSYNFPTAMPNMNMHAGQHAGNTAAAFFTMQNPPDGTLLDLSDPAMLDQFLGLPSEGPNADMSGFNWSRQ
uniref:Mating type protein n=1 Tax=Ophiostoma montium TaxID=230073 RepID=M4PIK4_9PEZI|nr:mating type protein [Ophiostoma montium]AGH03265.1 mating type protein [Ophiostoma montium]